MDNTKINPITEIQNKLFHEILLNELNDILYYIIINCVNIISDRICRIISANIINSWFFLILLEKRGFFDNLLLKKIIIQKIINFGIF